MIGCKFKFGKDTWELHLHGKYSFIVGDSSSGKSFLETSVSQYAAAMGSLPVVSGYRLIPYIVFIDLEIEELRHTDIVIVDEEDIGYSNVSKRNIYKRAEQTPCYFIFCTRELPTRLSYGYEDIFLLSSVGRYHRMENHRG